MNERSIFLAALEIPDPAERAAYLDSACAGDPSIRRGVEDLLAAHGRSGSFMSDPPFVPTTGDNDSGEGPGSRVGPYKLLQQIGEGGMGAVYMAEQEQPVRRMVALKIIREGMDTRQVVARFEAERQALALMDHPNIAHVLDAGTTSTGRPFFVMELVKGVPITKFCDENQLTLRERLELFVPVCQAIQHAHQKGVIHRDIKPSNVLVAFHDDQPVPKVIDFGVAKATSQKLTEKTLFTAFGAVIGTLEYMSPEQARLNQLDIDTRSDVYGLGVLLYELLTGTTPLDRARLKSAALDEVLRLIREEEPERPSTRLSTAQTRPAIAAARRAEPAQLGKVLRAELDWIVMKALEKDRARRYETASGLARDVQRYLKDEPVEACPPTFGYRLRKFARRYRPLLATAVAFFTLLAVGATVCVWQAVRATRAERDALAQSRTAENQRRLAEDREAAAVREADKARRLVGMMQELLGTADLTAEKGPDYTVRQMLDDFEAGLDERLKDQPEAEADLRTTIGKAYWSMRLDDKAGQQFERALKLRQRLYGPDDPKVAQTLTDLAWSLMAQDKGNEAEKQAAAAVAMLRRLDDQGEDLANALRILAFLQVPREKNLDKVEATYREALALAKRAAGGRPSALAANIAHDQARFLRYSDRADEGVKLARWSVDVHRKVHGDRHPETAYGLLTLGNCHEALGQWTDAERAYREALTIYRWAYGNQPHKFALTTLGSLLGVLDTQFKDEEADAILRDCLTAWQKPDLTFPHASRILRLRGAACLARGDYADAERHFRQALEERHLRGAPLDPAGITNRWGLGATLFYQDRTDDARIALQELVQPAREATLQADLHPDVHSAFAFALLVGGSGKAEDLQAARTHAERAVEKANRSDRVLLVRALVQQRSGELDRAIETLREVQAIARAQPLSVMGKRAEKFLVRFLTEKGDAAAAEEVLLDGVKYRDAHLPKGDPEVADAQVRLAAFLMSQKRYADAELLLQAAEKSLKAHPQRPASASLTRRLAEVRERLVQLYKAWDKPDELKKWQTTPPG